MSQVCYLVGGIPTKYIRGKPSVMEVSRPCHAGWPSAPLGMCFSQLIPIKGKAKRVYESVTSDAFKNLFLEYDPEVQVILEREGYEKQWRGFARVLLKEEVAAKVVADLQGTNFLGHSRPLIFHPDRVEHFTNPYS